MTAIATLKAATTEKTIAKQLDAKPDLKNWLEEKRKEVMVVYKRTTEDNIEIGKLLHEIKGRLDKENLPFDGWCACYLPFSRMFAYIWIKGFLQFGDRPEARNIQATGLGLMTRDTVKPNIRNKILKLAEKQYLKTKDVVKLLPKPKKVKGRDELKEGWSFNGTIAEFWNKEKAIRVKVNESELNGLKAALETALAGLADIKKPVK